MTVDYKVLSSEFYSMWMDDPNLQAEWDIFEKLCWVVKEATQNRLKTLSSSKNLIDIVEEVFKNNKETSFKDFYDAVIIMWNRILLRTCLKLQDSLEIMIYSCNTANAYGSALAARSIIEHTALLNYLVQSVPWRTSKDILQQPEKMFDFLILLNNLAQGSTFDWSKLLSISKPGSLKKIVESGEWKRPKAEQIPHISALVKSLDKELSSHMNKRDEEGYIQFTYSALCDVVHPSWGSDFIYAAHMHDNMKISKDFDNHFKGVMFIFGLTTIDVLRYFVVLIDFMVKNEPVLQPKS